MMGEGKCAMAKDKLCRMSRFGDCEAPEEIVENCPYAKAIRQLAILLFESAEKERGDYERRRNV